MQTILYSLHHLPLLCAKCLPCDSFATDYCISFNAKKSKCLVVFPRPKRFLYAQLSKCVFYVDGKPVEFVMSYPHLGHVINASTDDIDDISHRRGAFIGEVNNVLCYFITVNSHTKYRLFQSYCTSFYGCELWCLLDDEVQSLCTAWRKSIRKIWEQPYRTHSYLLPLLCCSLPLFDQLCIHVRSLNFVQRCLAHDSDVVNLFLTIVLSMVVAILILVRMQYSVCNGTSVMLKWCSVVR